jgi:fatty-acyl-CoA synthase
MAMQTKESYVVGATDVPLTDDTLGAYIDRVAARHADNEALVVVHQNVRWTWRELSRRVDNLAVGLMHVGLAPGDRIGMWSQNCAEWVLTQFAAAKAGLILVNINPAYRHEELEHALNKVGCKALIMSARFRGTDYVEMLRDVASEIADCVPGQLKSTRLPDLRLVIILGGQASAGMLNFEALLAPANECDLRELATRGATLRCDDPVNIQFTSGTTGSPKGATLTHRNLLNNSFFVGEAMKLTSQDRLCIPVPLYHCFGMVLGNLVCATHGATMVLPGEAFDAKAVLETVDAEKCTALHGVPTMFIALLAHPEFGRYRFGTLRTGIMAGSPCPVEVMKRVMERMNMQQVTIAYGMTETAPISFQSALDDPPENRVSTVGRVQPHLEVKIVDEWGRTVLRGAMGELLTRGYSVMRGYWNDPEKTSEAIDEEGWMHTGDLATIDEQGYCRIVGRSKDLIIRGGENICPRDVEEFLYRYSKIQDVQCVGVPDSKYGEELCACIILRPGAAADAEEIRSFCRGRIAHYKIPRYVAFLDRFPMTVTGKIQKYVLREQMTEAFKLNEEEAAS